MNFLNRIKAELDTKRQRSMAESSAIVVPQRSSSVGCTLDNEDKAGPPRPQPATRSTDNTNQPQKTGLYNRHEFARSQPALLIQRSASAQSLRSQAPGPPPQGPLPPLPPLPPLSPLYGFSTSSSGSHTSDGLQGKASSVRNLVLPQGAPHRRQSDEDTLGYDADMLREVADGVPSLTAPRMLGHRRGQGVKESHTNTLGPASAAHPGHHVPDYHSAPSSYGSMSSGYLTRGTSNSSTAFSDERSVKRPSLRECSVQQDFFLPQLRLTQDQRRLLLVSMPRDALDTYEELYVSDIVCNESRDGGQLVWQMSLNEELLVARGQGNLEPLRQRKVLQTCILILETSWGKQRLARFIRWALQPDLEEQRFIYNHQLREVTALSALELTELLTPLALSSAQQARLYKHCSTIPAARQRLNAWEKTYEPPR